MRCPGASWISGFSGAGFGFGVGLVMRCVLLAGVAGEGSQVEFIDPDPETGSSMAAVVSDTTLAHTAQMLPLDSDGELVSSDLTDQVDRVVSNLELALSKAGADREQIFKLHVYTPNNDFAEEIRQRLGRIFSGRTKPAVAFQVGGLAKEGAKVAMDAIATTRRSRKPDEGMVFYHHGDLYGSADRGHVSVMPPGARVYLSGQAAGTVEASGDGMREATQGTMQSLLFTLSYLGLSAEDVVQVKSFLHPIEEADGVNREIARFFRSKPTPPMVTVEWNDADYLGYLDEATSPIEIELHAYRGESRSDGKGKRLDYTTTPLLDPVPVFARICEVHDFDRLIYTSGLYGDPGKNAEGQVRDAFARLEGLLEKTGSDFAHLVKSTYYVGNEAASDAMNEVRGEYYEEGRAPTSSKMPVRQTGRAGCVYSFDMIAVDAPGEAR